MSKIIINIFNHEKENLKNYVIIEIDNQEKEKILEAGSFYTSQKKAFIDEINLNFKDYELID
jgi:hypothetical protein